MKQTLSISNYYRNSIQHLEEGIFWVNAKGEVRDWNTAFLAITAYEARNIKQLTIFEINPHLSRLQWKKDWQQLKTKRKLSRMAEYMSQTGQMLELREQLVALDDLAEPLVMITIQDVSQEVRNATLLKLTSTEGKIGAWEIDFRNESLVATEEFFSLLAISNIENVSENLKTVLAIFSDALPVNDYNYFFSEIEKLSLAAGTFSRELKMQFKEDVTKYFYFVAKSQPAQQEYLKVRGTLQDITAQKEQLQSFQLSQTTLNKVKEMIFWIDSAGNFTYVNDFACTELGYEREILLQMKVFDIAPNRKLGNWQQVWEKVKHEESTQYESKMLRTNRSEIPVFVSLNYIQDQQIEYICAVVRDIQEEKLRTAELNSALQQLERTKSKVEAENIYLQNEIRTANNFDNIISTSPHYFKVLQQVEQVARTDATVLILGETGTGKELLARAVHRLSTRNSRPLVKVNCAALPKNLIESELFGHEKGAFTGAIKRKIGRFELAHKGTIFLDEIGEIPIELQPKLLRVLQEGEYERVGSSHTQSVDVRVIAATNRDLPKLIQEEKFREDLYYRLNVFPIINIPLRERRKDIPLLAKFFTKKYSEKIGKAIKEIPPQLLEQMQQYDFPGNIRELENIIERAVILSPGQTLQIDEKVFTLRPAIHNANAPTKTFEQMQHDYIVEILQRTNWQVSGEGGAAEILDLNPKTLTSKMRKLNIRRQDYLDI